MSTTAARRRLVRSLVGDRRVESQQGLVDLLGDHGFVITQATASRDLQAVGAVKDGDVYVIDDHRHVNATVLSEAIDGFAESIIASGNIVVLHTPPGAAHLLAAAIDASGVEGVVGTVAGDDTVLVVASERVGGSHVARELERIGAMR